MYKFSSEEEKKEFEKIVAEVESSGVNLSFDEMIEFLRKKNTPESLGLMNLLIERNRFDDAVKKGELVIAKMNLVAMGNNNYYYISKEKFEGNKRCLELDSNDLILNHNYILTNIGVMQETFIKDLKKDIKKGYEIDVLVEKISSHIKMRTSAGGRMKWGDLGYDTIRIEKIKNEEDMKKI